MFLMCLKLLSGNTHLNLLLVCSLDNILIISHRLLLILTNTDSHLDMSLLLADTDLAGYLSAQILLH